MTEQYQGIIPYLKEDRLKEGTCTVRLEFSPYHQEQPGLRIYYAYKKSVSVCCLQRSKISFMIVSYHLNIKSIC